jgi:hypothetical protein
MAANWKDWTSQNTGENISIPDAEEIAEYCKTNKLPVPTMKIVNNQNRDFVEGLTFNEAFNQNNFPPNEDYLVMGAFSTLPQPILMATIKTAVIDNDKNGNHGFEDYFTVTNMTQVQQESREKVLMDVVRADYELQKVIFGEFDQLILPSTGE